MPCKLPVSFSAQAETGNQTSQLNLAAVPKSREGGTSRHKRRSEAKTCWDLGRRRVGVVANKIWLHLPWTHLVVPVIPGGGGKILPNSAPSHKEVQKEAEALVRCPKLTHHSTDSKTCSLQQMYRCFAETDPDL